MGPWEGLFDIQLLDVCYCCHLFLLFFFGTLLETCFVFSPCWSMASLDRRSSPNADEMLSTAIGRRREAEFRSFNRWRNVGNRWLDQVGSTYSRSMTSFWGCTKNTGFCWEVKDPGFAGSDWINLDSPLDTGHRTLDVRRVVESKSRLFPSSRLNSPSTSLSFLITHYVI